MKLVTSEQMRAFDKKTIETYGMPGIVLMENAARTVTDEIVRRYGPLKGQRVSIVCGKGNNGGDGLAIGRQLATLHGADVHIWLAEPMGTASLDAAINLMLARNYGLTIETISDPAWCVAYLRASHVVVDAVLGTGVTGDPRPAAATAIRCINDSGRPVVAVDLPSGLDADTGNAGEPTVNAAVTVTFALSKFGLHVFPGVRHAGEVVVADIGFPRDVQAAEKVTTIVTDDETVRAWLPSREQNAGSNKGQYGSIALLCGSPGFAGAATLASEGAIRSGAGLVTLGVPQPILDALMARAPDPVMTHPFPATPGGRFDLSALDEALAFCGKRDATGIGSGIGHEEPGVQEFILQFIARYPKPLVIDADALNILAALEDHGAAILKGRTASTIITPHPGEMGRLLGVETASVQADRLSAIKKYVATHGCVVILKGARTLIAAPDGRLAVNQTGNPGMANGGSGDVLTGVATTCAAQIADPWEAAAAAAYLHGLAGDLAAREVGLAGLIATDITRFMPLALSRVLGPQAEQAPDPATVHPSRGAA